MTTERIIRPVCFFYTDHRPSFEAMQEHIPQAEYVDTQKSSYEYWDRLEDFWDNTTDNPAGHWNTPYDLLVMEQHIIVHADVIPQLKECIRQGQQDWCVFPFGGQHHGLGCTRFSADLRKRVPSTEIRKRARRKCPHCGSLHFAFIDGPILDALRANGYTDPHIHHPPVEHLAQ